MNDVGVVRLRMTTGLGIHREAEFNIKGIGDRCGLEFVSAEHDGGWLERDWVFKFRGLRDQIEHFTVVAKSYIAAYEG